ncbi:MAG: bifunctional shikimate kinase/3-dehydroquinate synthase [Kiritimatiellae bacterium]|nr:bifunctional shikimate kinase/3-dehydroquinate synthase [Kiritimatiellia bacterium]
MRDKSGIECLQKAIFLYGAPASGKSTLGKALAERLGAGFVDLDERIVAEAGMSIPEIFKTRGEATFRDLESNVLREVVSVPKVVSLGGGTLLRDENRALCEENGTVFCIDTPSDEELARRIGAAPGSRPLGDKAKERAAHYASFPNRVAAFFDAQSSLVVVGRGIAPAILAGRNVVADETVARLWAGRLGISPFAIIPSGEEHKTPVTVAKLWRAFAEKGLGRKDTVVALGGGVTGDLTGFAAATWMRGISWINVPTTLLSMVDASTGGKTGCDLPDGKNLAGAFHFPKLVVIDTDFLETLSPKLVSDGRAEMIKHEAIGGKGSGVSAKGSGVRSWSSELELESGEGDFGWSKGSGVSAKEIAENLMVKVGIVCEDPLETLGRRILLNCGHTVAHAIEKATGYRVSHGEAVAIGCVEEAKIAVRRGLAPASWPEEFAARFAVANLPTSLPAGLSLEGLVPLMRGDKKREGGAVTFALPCGWGDVRGVKIDLSKESL